MADQKLSELPALGAAPADTDEVYLRDVSEVGTAQRKRLSIANLRIAIGNLLELKNYRETRTAPTIFAGVLTLDIANGNSFEVTLTENVTSLVITGWPISGKTGFLTLFLTQDATGGRTFAWPAAIIWAGGTVPVVSSAANARDLFTLVSNDAGATPYGMTGGQAFS